MEASEKLDVDWFETSLQKLSEIEANADDYVDEEEGDKAPDAEIFNAVKSFLKTVKNKIDVALETPRFFVSPNGSILVTFSNKKCELDIRFSPELHLYYKDSAGKVTEGASALDAIDLIKKHFKI